MFPFEYKGVTYNQCTMAGASKPWCYTNSYGSWEYCAPCTGKSRNLVSYYPYYFNN